MDDLYTRLKNLSISERLELENKLKEDNTKDLKEAIESLISKDQLIINVNLKNGQEITIFSRQLSTGTYVSYDNKTTVYIYANE